MKKCIFLLLVLAVTWAAPVYAQVDYCTYPTYVDTLGHGVGSGRTEYHQSWDRILSADTMYILTSLYYVDSTYTLTIPAGTIIKGDTAATLIIARGAKIFAEGDPCCPIVFTSMKDPGDRGPGDWGGIIILGRAPCNKVEPLIEGGIIGGTYGGNDPNDDSGVFKYVRIEFPGYRFQLNNEVNGLTMGGVGRGTELHHVQVSYSFDDSYEWFGGTVDAKYLVAYGGTDDEFDTDFGYQGRAQFLFGLRDPYSWDPNGESNGFESDNDGSSSSTAVPYTQPVFCNATLIGPFTDADSPPPGHKFQYSAVLRRSTKTNIFNTVVAGYPWGLTVRDKYTHKWCWFDTMFVSCTSLAAQELKYPYTPTVHDSARWVAAAPTQVDSCTQWFDRPQYFNYYSAPNRTLAAVGITIGSLTDPNPVPAEGEEPDTATTCWNNPKLMDPFFTQVDYRGAFEPGVEMEFQWTRGWTNFDPHNTNYVLTAVEEEVHAPRAELLAQNYPNPFNPTTIIKFTVPAKGHVNLSVYNVAGERVATLVDRVMEQGTYESRFSAANLASGVYLYKLSGKDFSETKKMVLLR